MSENMPSTGAHRLTDTETAQIQREIAHYADKSAASIEALKIVQKHRGWVSDENIQAIASLLDMSPERLDGVATFYNLIFRRPVGKNVICYCNSVSCWMLGCDRLQQHLSARLGIQPGETTGDGKFTLLPIVCLGACDRAPVLMVGETLHPNVNEEILDAIIGS